MHFIALLGLKVLGLGAVFASSSLGIAYYKDPTVLGLDKEGINWSGKPSETDEEPKKKQDEDMLIIAEGITSSNQPSQAINYTTKNYVCKYDGVIDKSCAIEKIDFGDKKWLYASSIKTDDTTVKKMVDGAPPKSKELFKVQVSKEIFEIIDLNDLNKKISVDLVDGADSESYSSLQIHIAIKGQDIKHQKTKYKVAKASEYGSYYNDVIDIVDDNNKNAVDKTEKYKCINQKFDMLKTEKDNGLEKCRIKDFSKTKNDDFNQLKLADLITETTKIETDKHYLFIYNKKIDHEADLKDKKSTDKIFYYLKNGLLQEHLATFIEYKPAILFNLLTESGKPKLTKNLLIID